MIRLMLFSPDGDCRTDIPLSELTAVLQDPTNFVWVEMDQPAAAEAEALLRDTFHFHPLAVEDALLDTNAPRIDDWGTYLYIILQGIYHDHKPDPGLELRQLDVFLGERYLITYHDRPITAVQRVWEGVQRDERLLRFGPDHLLYRVADELISDYTSVLDRMEDTLDLIEARVFSRPDEITLSWIFGLKRELLQMRRLVIPQRELFNKLARDPYPVIDAEDRVFFRDLYDHMLRLYDLMENLRDMVGGAMEIYLSVVNNRMNDIMKTLTIITTFFMPLTFITGFFGMNFFQPVMAGRFWTGPAALALAFLALAAMPLFMYWWMRRRAWM